MGDNFASIKRMATPIVQKVKSEIKLDPTMNENRRKLMGWRKRRKAPSSPLVTQKVK